MKTVWILSRIFNVMAALALFYITVVALVRWILKF